jgi:hypothetical protein
MTTGQEAMRQETVNMHKNKQQLKGREAGNSKKGRDEGNR